MRATIGVALLVMSIAGRLGAQSAATSSRAVLSGYVIEATADTTVHPLADVEILDLERGRSTRSNQYGAYRLEGLTAGLHLVRVRRVGFAPLTVQVDLLSDDVTEVDLRLQRATRLDTMLVVAPATEGPVGFLRRSANGMGTYFSREQIERTHARSVADLLRRTGGVRLDPVTGEAHAPRTEYKNSDGPRCARMVVMVDGVVRADGLDSRQLAADHVAGIEVYTSAATLPFELRNFESAMCGLIAVWTR